MTDLKKDMVPYCRFPWPGHTSDWTSLNKVEDMFKAVLLCSLLFNWWLLTGLLFSLRGKLAFLLHGNIITFRSTHLKFHRLIHTHTQILTICWAHSTSVVDQHRFHADPDPTFHFDTGPDPDPSISYTRIGKSGEKKKLIGFYSHQCQSSYLVLSILSVSKVSWLSIYWRVWKMGILASV